MVVLFFGGIGFYYFKVYQWQDLENPRADLQVVKNDDTASLADFRRFTVPNIVDPALHEMSKLVTLRKSTNAATVTPEEFDQNCKEIANKLRDLMGTAKLRRIPKQYEKRYNAVVDGLSEIYRSLRKLEEAMGEDIPDAKRRALDESIKLTNSAKKNLNSAREVFLIQQR